MKKIIAKNKYGWIRQAHQIHTYHQKHHHPQSHFQSPFPCPYPYPPTSPPVPAPPAPFHYADVMTYEQKEDQLPVLVFSTEQSLSVLSDHQVVQVSSASQCSVQRLLECLLLCIV